MAHGRRSRCAVPVLLARLEPDYVAGTDFLDGAALALHPAATACHDEGLAERMRMPGGPGAGFKRHQGHTDAGGLGWIVQGVDPDRTGEPVGRPLTRWL